MASFRYFFLIFALTACIAPQMLTAATTPAMTVSVDLRDAPRGILHAKLSIPVHQGRMELDYPEWIPGTHSPAGPIENLTGLFISANGKPEAWQRDPINAYKFHLNIPQGVIRLDVSLDFLGYGSGIQHGGRTTNIGSQNVTVLAWHTVILYPDQITLADVNVETSIVLPPDSHYATSLEAKSNDGAKTNFKTTNLERLLDSPVLIGSHFRRELIPTNDNPPVYVNVAADNADDAIIPPECISDLSTLIDQAKLIFKTEPYSHYDFLVALSNTFSRQSIGGQEHLMSSDNRGAERTMNDPSIYIQIGNTLSHEYFHVWNGKYRRPIGEAVANYNIPIRSDLVWIYEGLTMYYGNVLAARSGFWNEQTFVDNLALTAAYIDNRPGRQWRDLQDVASGEQMMVRTGPRGDSWRRGSDDYYQEGELLWLDVDVRIRKLSHGTRSLDDFCEIFGSKLDSRGNSIVPYDLDEVIADLNKVAPGDWRAFFLERLHNHEHAPLGGLDGAGWRLVYDHVKSPMLRGQDILGHELNAWYSLGFIAKEDGTISDVLWGSPADKRGLTPGSKLVAVDGQTFSLSSLTNAIAHSEKEPRPIQLTAIDSSDLKRSVSILYEGGVKYPHLERLQEEEDILANIVHPRTTATW